MKEFNFLDAIHDASEPLDKIASSIPAFLHVNRISDLRPVYLDPKLKAFIGHENKTTEDIINNAFDFVHSDDLQPAIDATLYYLSRLNDYKTISFTQRILNYWTKSYHPFYTTSMFIESRSSLISFSMPFGGISSLNKPIDTVLDEMAFARKHVNHWIQLSKRELEMVRYWMSETDNDKLAQHMNISAHSVKSYKKRIYKKLKINQYSQLYQYAQAFDLN